MLYCVSVRIQSKSFHRSIENFSDIRCCCNAEEWNEAEHQQISRPWHHHCHHQRQRRQLGRPGDFNSANRNRIEISRTYLLNLIWMIQFFIDFYLENDCVEKTLKGRGKTENRDFKLNFSKEVFLRENLRPFSLSQSMTKFLNLQQIKMLLS